MTRNPTYYNLGDHSETVQIDFDPARVSYKDLLEFFWESHNPIVPPYSQQYKSAIFYHTEEQKALATMTRQREEARSGKKIYTEIKPFREFYLAEDYHQKHRLRQVPDLLWEYREIYPDLKDFLNSTAVTRVNGYVSGCGSMRALQRELPDLGLSPEASKRLTDIVHRLLG